MSLLTRRAGWFVSLCLLASAAHAVRVDGRIEPGEWAGARHITDFRDTQPLTGKPGSLRTEAWILATPEGLAVAFHAVQPPSVRRTRQRTRRDESAQVDRVNLMIDFDGDGRTGYDFVVTSMGDITDEVITDEANFSSDWDGVWQHAVAETPDGWSVEMLIPWYIAPMRAASGDTREVSVYLDRVVGSTGERMAWPTASFNRARFLSDFAPVSLTAYSQSLLAVTPYLVAKTDQSRGRVGGGTRFQDGADLVWKPNGQTQLTATINPDFGQVESDDLVVNFSPEETFFSDKRPFFTENQGIFDFSLQLDYTQLVYTRRVGGAADDGSGESGIAGALKLNGSVGGTNYGVLAAQETGDAGRTFAALRVNHAFGTQSLGLLATHVERPFLQRDANVLGIDHRWQPNAKFTLISNVVGDRIDEPGHTSHGFGATAVASYEMGPTWSQQWLGMHFNDRLDINDFGYLPRNDFDYLHWEVRQRLTGLPADSMYASHSWRYRVIAIDNTHGLTLERRLRVSRDSQLRNGGQEFWRLSLDSAAYDDLLTRGGNPQRTPPNASLSYQYTRPRHGAWAWQLEADLAGNALSGLHRWGYSLEVIPTYFINDALSVSAGGSYQNQPNLLVWQRDNLVSAFDARTLSLDAGVNWNVGSRHELRIKLQNLAVGAQLRQAYEISPSGRAVPSTEPADDFGVRNLGFQIRYRYNIAPLSDLYIVYNRGGYASDLGQDDPGTLFRRSFSLRDVEQGLVKVAYRLVF